MLKEVRGKRAKYVVGQLLKHGSVTTDQIAKDLGERQPPRARRDVVEQGIPILTRMINTSDGRRIAQYSFGDLDNIAAERAGGRVPFPAKFKKALVDAYGARCGFCHTAMKQRYLRIDHRVPFSVSGDDAAVSLDVKDFLLVCGPCNSVKMQCCKECPNGLAGKDAKVCLACYWANPIAYAHIATLDVRRLDLTWTGTEVSDYDAAKAQSESEAQSLPTFVKQAVRKALRSNPPKPP